MKHTPTPWKMEKGGRIYGGSKRVADCDGHAPNWIDPVDEANSAFIVRACNAHEDLINKIKSFLSDYDSNHGYMGSVEELRSAFDKAEGRE